VAGLLIVTLDGPSGSGKSTVGQELARRLGLRYVDSGSMYRALALLCLREDDPETAAARAAELARGASIVPRWDGREHRVFLDGEDVSLEVREPRVSRWASRVSADSGVRGELVAQQRRLARPPGLVMDGRDIGTVVFPEAPFKFYLVASLEERGRRRAADESSADRAGVARELALRDRQDSSRDASPLKPAADAVVVDTTDLTAEQVVESILNRIRGGSPGRA
jgi:cytidylate kinase